MGRSLIGRGSETFSTEPRAPASGPFLCAAAYSQYSIQYTTTPVTLTYIQMGSVHLAIAR